MKLLIALTALVACVSCARLQSPSPQQITDAMRAHLADDMAWCRTHSGGQVNECVDALTKRRAALMQSSAIWAAGQAAASAAESAALIHQSWPRSCITTEDRSDRIRLAIEERRPMTKTKIVLDDLTDDEADASRE